MRLVSDISLLSGRRGGGPTDAIGGWDVVAARNGYGCGIASGGRYAGELPGSGSAMLPMLSRARRFPVTGEVRWSCYAG